MVLSDFGGAFSMGAIGGGIWHGIKGARNSPRVCYLFFQEEYWHLKLELFSGRTFDWRSVSDKGTSTSDRRKLWRLGWDVLDVRLRGEGLETKRRRMERYHLRVHDGWLFGSTE